MSAFETQFPLPPIESADLQKEVFTHRSVAGLPAGQNYEEGVQHDNERLALLGNEVIALIVTDVLFHRLNNSRPGDLDSKRQKLVRKENLKAWCDGYGLWTKLQTHRSQTLVIQNNLNARVQVFQAYVGALYKESGIEIIKGWLEPIILDNLRDMAEAEAENLS